MDCSLPASSVHKGLHNYFLKLQTKIKKRKMIFFLMDAIMLGNTIIIEEI